MTVLLAAIVVSAYLGIDCFREEQSDTPGNETRTSSIVIFRGGLYYVDAHLCTGKICGERPGVVLPEDATEEQPYARQSNGIGYFNCVRRQASAPHVVCNQSDTGCAACNGVPSGTTCTTNRTVIGLCFAGQCAKACSPNGRCSTPCSCASLNDCASPDSLCTVNGTVENITSVFTYRETVRGPNGFGYCKVESNVGQKLVRCINGKICNKFGTNFTEIGSTGAIYDPQYVCLHEGGRVNHTNMVLQISNPSMRTCLSDFGAFQCGMYERCIEDGGDTFAKTCVPNCYASYMCSSRKPCTCETAGDCKALSFCHEGLQKHVECESRKSLQGCVPVQPCPEAMGNHCATCVGNAGSLCRRLNPLSDKGDLGVCHYNNTCAALSLVGGSLRTPSQYIGYLFSNGRPVCGDTWNEWLALQSCIELGYNNAGRTE